MARHIVFVKELTLKRRWSLASAILSARAFNFVLMSILSCNRLYARVLMSEQMSFFFFFFTNA
jgi:hypothetical protein